MVSIGSQLVISAGVTLKSSIANAIAIANAKTIAPRESSVSISSASDPSSCAAYCAEIESARKPIASDSPSAMMPRTIGSRKTQCRFITDSIGRQTSAICPFGFRTATAQFEGPRIITPSRTAWPPIGCDMSL